VTLSALGSRPLFSLMYKPQMMDDGDDELGAQSGMIDKRNRNTPRKPATLPLFRPQITHDLYWIRTLGAAVGSRRRTAWATALLSNCCKVPVINVTYDSLSTGEAIIPYSGHGAAVVHHVYVSIVHCKGLAVTLPVDVFWFIQTNYFAAYGL
jgi:hypothetical protein